MASKVNGLIEKINPGNGTEYSLASTAYGYCETAAATKAKVVDMDGFVLIEGVTIHVKFLYANSASSPTLNVNGTGAKNIVQYGTTAVGTASATSGWYAGAIVQFTYDGTSWVRDQGFNTNSTYNVESIYTSTSAGTAAKVGTGTYALESGKYFQVLVTTANTAKSALTLNINGKGAKPIYINGEPSSATNYTLPQGYYMVHYDGTNYYFRTDGLLTADITGNAASADYATSAGYANTAGVADSANSVAWGNISGKPSSYYTLPVATSTALGGVKIGYTTNAASRNYAVQLSDEKMYVNVPWENTYSTVSTTGSGNAITSITANNGEITATKGTTFLTTHQSVSNKGATLSWGTATTVATIGSTNITISLPNNPDTNTTYTFATGTTSGTFKVTPSTTSTTQEVSIYGLGTNAFTSTAFAPINSPALTGSPTAPTPSSSSGNTAIATKGYVDSAFAANDAMIFKGTISGSSTSPGAYTPAAERGHTYKVLVAGYINGVKVEVGDVFICTADSTAAATSSTYSTVQNNWVVVQTNLDGVVIGPTSAVNGQVAVFDGTTGKLIKDSGLTLGVSVPATAVFTDTTYTFDGTYNASTNKAATVSSITSRIEALDGSITGTPSASQTLTAFSQTNGIVSATFGNISITKSQVSDFDHVHGNISMAGIVTTTATIANGDKLLITDSSTANRVVASSISFDTSTTNNKAKALTQYGTWESFNNYSLPTASSTTKGGIKVGTTLAISSEVLNLASVTVTTATSTTSPAHSGTFTAIDSVTVDSYGRVTGYNTKTVTLPSDNNTTYTFTSGTNGFTVKPSNSTSTQTVTVTPSIANNITGSGTSGYLAKFNSSNTIEDGVAFGTDTTKFLRNDGTWVAPTDNDTKNTAGSTQDSNKLFMVGAKSQTASTVTYSHTAVYATAGAFAATSYKIAEAVTLQYNNTTNALDFVFA